MFKIKADINPVAFEDLGYFKEYYMNGKYLGFARSEKDREVFGYYGKKEEVLAEAITLQNKKVIKAGTTVVTQLFPMCGKLSDGDRPSFATAQKETQNKKPEKGLEEI